MSPKQNSKSPEANPGDRLIVFAHMPKAGGTSLVRALQRLYPDESIYTVRHNHPAEDIARFQHLSEDEVAKLSLLHGHAATSLIPTLRRPYWAFTFLRDPIERVRSLYYYVQASPSHPLHEKYKNASLEEFVRGEKAGEAGNHQMRVLARAVPQISEFRDDSGRFWFDVGDDPKELIEAYREAFDQTFSFIGFLERYDESVLLLSRLLGVDPIRYTRRNITQHKNRNHPLTESERSLLEEVLAPELLFYRQELKKFDDEIARLGEPFQVSLAEYRSRKRDSRPGSRPVSPRRGSGSRAASSRASVRFQSRTELPRSILRYLPHVSNLPPAYGLMR